MTMTQRSTPQPFYSQAYLDSLKKLEKENQQSQMYRPGGSLSPYDKDGNYREIGGMGEAFRRGEI
jgi:hypothetical protein